MARQIENSQSMDLVDGKRPKPKARGFSWHKHPRRFGQIELAQSGFNRYLPGAGRREIEFIVRILQQFSGWLI